ncbi:MAG: exodeoxyribonuclease [Frankiales bacterium]|nr:exodeoxyribonuclease [Frankiales bacterium]
MFSILSANVNGARAALRRGGLSWLAAQAESHAAVAITLQEVRADDVQLLAALAGGGLGDWQVAHAVAERKGHAGVAVLSRVAPRVVRIGLPGFGSAGRWLEVELDTPAGVVTVASGYVFTGEAGTERQVEKYAFLDAMSARLDLLNARAASGGGGAVITGDLNVAHRPEDLKNWKGNLGRAGFLDGERAYLDRWLAAGWADLGRRHGGDGPGPYTWWSWRGRAFDADTGWRIDYQLATPGLADRSVKSEVGRAPSYAERWSDHASVTTWFD